jgi:transposase
MSLRSSPDSAIPEDTLRVAHTAFPKGSVFMRMRDALGPIYRDPLKVCFGPQPSMRRWSVRS